MIADFSFVLDQRLMAMPLSVPSSSTKYKIYGILAVRKNGSLTMIFPKIVRRYFGQVG